MTTKTMVNGPLADKRSGIGLTLIVGDFNAPFTDNVTNFIGSIYTVTQSVNRV